MYLAFDFNPVDPSPMDQQILKNAQGRSMPNSNSKPRDLSPYVTDIDWTGADKQFRSLSPKERINDLWDDVTHVLCMVMEREEKVSREVALEFIGLVTNMETFAEDIKDDIQHYDIGATREIRNPEYKRLGSIGKKHGEDVPEFITAKYDYRALVLDTASRILPQIAFVVFQASIKLNLQNFYYVFPSNFTVHDPKHILRIITDPQYVMSDKDTLEHFNQNRNVAFSILNAFSIQTVSSLVDSDQQVLQSAGRYQLLKAAFERAAEVENKDADSQPTPEVKLNLEKGDAEQNRSRQR